MEVAYNVQTVVENQNKLVVEYETTNENDRKAQAEMTERGAVACERKSLTVLADKGYHNGEQIYACSEQSRTTLVAQQEVPRSGPLPTPEYYGTRFKYHPRKDTCTCLVRQAHHDAEGNEMRTNGHWYKKKCDDQVTEVKHYKTTKCVNCLARSLCTTNPAGRLIERSQYATAVERNAKNLTKQHELYKERQQLIEHVFGTIKRQWGFDHILLKGIRKNNGEMGLICFVYNFRRYMNILAEKLAIKRGKLTVFLLLRTLITTTRITAISKLKNIYLPLAPVVGIGR